MLLSISSVDPLDREIMLQNVMKATGLSREAVQELLFFEDDDHDETLKHPSPSLASPIHPDQ